MTGPETATGPAEQAAPAAAGASPSRSLSQQAADLAGRVRAMPRTSRLALYGVLAFVAFVAADDLLWAPARAWAEESRRIEQALDRGRDRDGTVTSELRRSIATFGPVEPPGPASTGREELAKAIDEVLKRNKVAGYSFETRSGQKVKDADAAGLGGSVERMQAEVKFDTTADALPRLVAELESHPAIDAIASIRIEKNDQNRKIGVQATIEAWVQAGGGRRTR